MSNFFTNVIGRKLVMSLTGLFLILFLLFHASMNLVAVFSEEGYNAICEFLGANWYALAATVVLAGGFFFHIIYAFWITLQNLAARGNQRYAMTSRPKEVSWASKNMLVLGIIVIGFACLHLYQFWAKMQLVEILGQEPANGVEIIKLTFGCPIFAACYIIWLVALWFHLTHGFWSAFHTLGWNNQIWISRLECIAKWFATIVCAMFIIVVIVFYIRSTGGCPICM